MLILRYRLLPAIRSHLAIFISLVLVTALATALLLGVSGACEGVKLGLEEYTTDYGYPDVMLNTALGGDSEALLALEGVSSVTGRWVDEVELSSGERLLSGRLFGVTNGDDFYLREGSLTNGGLWVEYKFANYNGFSPGDLLTLYSGAGDAIRVEIAALVSSPDCISAQQTDFFWGDAVDFGFVFATKNQIEQWYGSTLPDCQFRLMTEEGVHNEDVLEEAHQCLAAYGVISGYTYEDSPVHKAVRYSTEPVDALSRLLPLIVFGVMLLTICLFLAQLIKRQQSQIGLYLALGFTKRAILLLLCGYTFAVTLVGTGVGCALAAWLMGFISNLYADYFSMPPFVSQFSLELLVPSALASFAVGQVAVLISAFVALRIQPVDALRGIIPPTQPPRCLSTVLSQAPMALKLAVSSMLRHKTRFILSVVCMAASGLLIVLAFSFHASKESTLVHLFGDRLKYDCFLLFNSEIDAQALEELRAIDGVEACETLVCGKADLEQPEGDEVILYGLEKGQTLLGLTDDSGGFLEPPQDGIFLEWHLARQHGLATGSSVVLSGQELTIQGLSRQDTFRIHFTTTEQALAVTGLSGPNACLLLVSEAGETAVRQFASRQNSCIAIVFTRLLQQTALDEFRLYDIGVAVITVVSLLLSLVIVYNMSRISLEERRREYGTLMTLGFLPGGVSSLLLTETLTQLALSLLLSLSSGAMAADSVLSAMSTDIREYPLANDWRVYAAAAAVMLVFTLMTHLLTLRSVRRLDLIECTKSND